MADDRKYEYVLKESGAVARRTIYEAELDLSDQFVAALSKDMDGKIRKAMFIPDLGHISLTVNLAGVIHYCVNLQRLMIRAPWRLLEKDGVMVPNFSSKTDPLITMKWVPPATLRLAMIVNVRPMDPESKLYQWGGSWLFAMDNRNYAWRLPISNVHDDGSCCTGIDMPMTDDTPHEVLMKLLTNFDNAPYNSDLWKNSELTQQFFRMKADKENYVTVPPPTKWTDFCTKIGTAITKYVILP